MRGTSTRCLLLALLCLTATGCALPYYIQAATGQAKLLRQRVPIAEVIADASVDADTRRELMLVTELRRFAVTELGLPDNDSYTSYVALDADAVVFNVIAAPEFSIEPKTWCFPVAGCVAYRGYFDPERARRFGRRLADRGYDVFVGGSPAYSTLGHFDDPVLSTMLSRGDTDLAATLFHELAHQRIYVKDDTDLNESFATTVEQYGVEQWLALRSDAHELERYRQKLVRDGQFALLVERQRERLAALFGTETDPDRLRVAKAEAYAEMQRDYAGLRAGWDGHDDYGGWFSGGFDNAKLVALTSYRRWVPGMRARIERLGPAAFYAEVQRLIALDEEQRQAVLVSWNSSSDVTALPDRGKRIDRAADVGPHDGQHLLGLDTERGKAIVAAHARDRQRAQVVARVWLARHDIFADQSL